MEKFFGNRRVCLVKELTKIHEEHIYGDFNELIERYKDNDIKGEYVVIVEGSKHSKKEINISMLCEKTLEDHYKYYEKKGMDKKEIIKQIAKDRKVTKNEIYQRTNYSFCDPAYAHHGGKLQKEKSRSARRP
jgi:16S rRNA (cytidine1402-2'-O)-methyltransferase